LRTVKGNADSKDQSVFLHFKKPTQADIKQGSLNLDLNKLMQNVGGEQFDYQTFKAAYDSDPTIEPLVNNFNSVGIELKTNKNTDDTPQGDPQSDNIENMAKRAVDLKDL